MQNNLFAETLIASLTLTSGLAYGAATVLPLDYCNRRYNGGFLYRGYWCESNGDMYYVDACIDGEEVEEEPEAPNTLLSLSPSPFYALCASYQEGW